MSDEDLLRMLVEHVGDGYELGASSFVTRPQAFSALAETFTIPGKHWFEVAALPPPVRAAVAYEVPPR